MGSGSSANGNPSAGTEASISSISDPFPVTNLFTSNIEVNFGQRSFNYSAPTDFKPLCTALFPTPTIADGSDYFDVSLWTGNGSTQSITGLSFSPDFVWIKGRSGARNHGLFNTIAGVNKGLHANLTDAEFNDPSTLTAFNSNGFSLSTNVTFNANTETFVAWAWDAGTSTASNTDGSITSNVRASQTNGFSVVTYTGNGTANSTVGHGLNAAPSWIIIKNRDQSPRSWMVLHTSAGLTGTTLDGSAEYNMLKLESTNAAANLTNDNIWNPTNTTFKINGEGTGNSVNYSGDDYVAYVWAPVEGYSAFGSYEGTGSASTAAFVYTGMRPRWIMVKNVDTGDSSTDWFIYDTARSTFNAIDDALYPNKANAEAAETSHAFDILSNGFKVRSTSTSGLSNKSGDTYIYAAFSDKAFSLNGGLAR